MNRLIEEYGTVSMSSPFLTQARNDLFSFDLEKGPNDYFNDAKSARQGAAASVLQQVLAVSGSFGATEDRQTIAQMSDAMDTYLADKAARQRYRQLTDTAADDQYRRAIDAANQIEDRTKRDEALAKAQADYLKSIAPTGEAATFPTTQPLTAPTPTTLPSASELITAVGFSNAGALLPQSFAPALANRDAIQIAAGDTAVETIFSMLGKPDVTDQFRDRAVVLGAVTVSVNPGWRTRQGFVGEVVGLVEYAWQPTDTETARAMLTPRGTVEPAVAAYLEDPANALALPERFLAKDKAALELRTRESTPLVAVVSPLSEGQTLDLASSVREQTQLALSMAVLLQATGSAQQANAMLNFARKLESDARTITSMPKVNSFSQAGGVFGFRVMPEFIAQDPLTENPTRQRELLERSFPALISVGLDRGDLNPIYVVDQKQWMRPAVRITDTMRWIPRGTRYATYRLDAANLLTAHRKAAEAALVMVGDTTDKSTDTRELASDMMYSTAYAFGASSTQSVPVDVVQPKEGCPAIATVFPRPRRLRWVRPAPFKSP